MTRRLVMSYLLLVVFALVVFTVPVGISLASLLTGNQEEVGLREARTVAVLLAELETAPSSATAEGAALALEALRTNLEEQTDGRVELLSSNGSPALGRDVLRPTSTDLADTRDGKETVLHLDESLLGEPGLQVTVPALSGDQVVGAVRLTYPSGPVDRQIIEIWVFRALAGCATLAVATVIARWLARSMTRPLRMLDAMAGQLSAGDFSARADVTAAGPEETRLLAETLNDGARRIGTLVDAQQRFVADASHQLRTPLTALRLSLDNLHDGLESENDRHATDHAIAETVRMTRLVNDLLALTRAQSAVPSIESVSISSITRERTVAWEAAAAEAQVTLNDEVPQQIFVRMTRGHLEQILDNTLSNAIAFSPAGSTVTVTAHAGRARVLVQIHDEGPGLSDGDIERALDRFWRGPQPPSGHSDGSGLGLPIAAQLAEENGGSITLRRGDQRGLVVTLELRPA